MSRPLTPFRVFLWPAKGRGQAIPSRAKFYSIALGKRKVVVKTQFPARYRLVSQKKKYLEKLLYELETARSLALKDRHRRRTATATKRKRAELRTEQARKQKEKIAKLRRERRQQRAIEETKREIADLLAEREREMALKREQSEAQKREDALIEEMRESIDREVLDVRNTTTENLEAIQKVDPDSVVVFPFIPKSDVYEKELITRRVMRDEGDVDQTLLDVNLREGYEVSFSAEDFHDGVGRAYRMLSPHLRDYYRGIKKVDDHFLLRIKFTLVNPFGSTTEMGISMQRESIHSWRDLGAFMMETLLKLSGTTETANYLEGNRIVVVTGFTVESGSLKEYSGEA